MACFFVWMAHIFMLASFWKFMVSAWFIRKDKDFLHVQSEHCKRLCSIIPNLEKFLKDLEAFPKTKVLNRNQCTHLFGNLILAMKGIQKMLSIATGDLKFQSIFEELCFLQKKVEIVGISCIEQDQWCHAVVFQLQNKETFRELLLDLKCCHATARDIYLFHHSSQSNDVPPIQFDVVTHEQVLEDANELKKKLELIVQGEVLEGFEIAQHLLLRLRNLDRVDGGDLNALEIPQDFKPPNIIQKIGKGGYGNVYQSNWFGLPCATKVLEGDPEYLMASHKEAGILAGLSHPNLVQFFGCGINKKIDKILQEEKMGGLRWVVHLKKSSLFQTLKSLVQLFGFGIFKRLDENPKEDETSEMYLVMELMDSNLSSILKEAKGPLPYHLAIDIMHQIAKGVYYLHDMQVAHLDLKPDNVLSSSIPMEDLDAHRIFKVMDYGTSQLEVCSNPKNPEPSKYTLGTPRYMAPEMIKGNKAPLHPFRVDAWSFAMICSEILSRKVPYDGLKPKEFRDQISCTQEKNNRSLRPDLPNNCKELTKLIQECWSQDPLQRPTFSNICKRLTSLKKSFLKGTYSCEMVPKFGSPCTLRDPKPILDLVRKVEDQFAPQKEVFVDLEHQLCKAKELLKLNYVGIVGMGGIGKTTLAKAIFDDKAVKSSYQASCFVAQCKNYQNLYEILYKILPKLKNDQKSKNLEVMMEEFFFKNKVLLILDDVKDEAQVHDIVPPNIVQASKGTTIIITTRKWNTIKSFVGIEGRLDVELLDKKAATTLFTTHLSWGVGTLSPDFEDLCKHVVKACNGLPLSLKVMGSFLRNKERLRSWERALQRMARGKNLDGDEELWNTLKISYDGLNDGVEKGMFLDLACFFCRDVYPSGISRETILYMWSKDGILPMNELERLIDMSLLKLNEDGSTLEMHDQLRDMGRMIAGGSRVWKASMIPESGFTRKDVEVLEGISLEGTMVQYDFDNQLNQEGSCEQRTILKHDQGFDFQILRVLILVTTLGTPKRNVNNLDLLLRLASQCPQLETVIIGNSNNLIQLPHSPSTQTSSALEDGISNLCRAHASLKALDLIGLGFLKHLPNIFASSHTLLRLDLSSCFHLVALPNEVGNFSSLIVLNLKGCLNLVTLPKEVGNLSSLTTLRLSGCSSLVTLPQEVGNLFSLITLNLRNCLSLVTLPQEVGNLSSLRTLDLRDCSNLVTLPQEVGNLSSLTILHLRDCSSLVTLPQEVGNLSSLTTLDMRKCSSLMTLPQEVGNLSSLTTFYLGGCLSLVTLPQEVGNLSSLTTLDMRKCSSLMTLPQEVGNLSSLTTFYLGGCLSLVTLPQEVGNLFSLTTLGLWDCSSLLPFLQEVGNLSSLFTFYLCNCSTLVTLPQEVGYLSSLTTLYLNRCLSLVKLPQEVGKLSSLTALDLTNCSSLVTLPQEVGNLSSLTTLSLSGCSSLVNLPQEMGNLSSLTTLDLRGCSSLVTLPQEVGNLSSLTSLNLEGCLSLLTLPQEVRNLSSLTTLYLWDYSSLVTLSQEEGNLSSLTTLDLSRSSLVALPQEVGNLSSLTTLNLSGCSNLVTLSQEVGNLSSLTTLNFRGCSSLVTLPQEVGNLSSLTTLDLSGCSSLVTLPKEVGNWSSLRTLKLGGCSSLVALPKEVEKSYHLVELNLDGCILLSSLPKNLGWIPSLRILSWKDCPNLESFMLVEMSSPTSLASLDGKFFCLEGGHHHGIRCDGCQMIPIMGPRLKAKATFKLDYDLCFKCFTKWKQSLENLNQ